ncbi:MAG: energy-coupling factor transport system permease protein [Actinomycetota bacterium]|jgi:energy-coupling factor transport system permease protein
MRRRALHPLAWWGWAGLLGAAALRTTNPLLCGLVVAVSWFVVASRRQDAPWARSFSTLLKVGVVVLLVRVLLQALFADRLPGRVLFTLPEARLPDWAAGVSLGGQVTAEAVAQAVYPALQLLALLAALGAASALADPYRLVRALPAAVYEVGVALGVGLTLAPQLGAEVGRIRGARRMRGRPTKGWAGIRGVAVPVLEGALERSVALAATMDARGFGRRGEDARGRLSALLPVVGLVALGLGTYAIADNGPSASFGLGLLGAGVVLLSLGLAIGGRRSARTRYRPDPWLAAEWATVGAGAVALALMVLAGRAGVVLAGDVAPLRMPSLPVVPALGVLLAAAPAVVTPEPA